MATFVALWEIENSLWFKRKSLSSWPDSKKPLKKPGVLNNFQKLFLMCVRISKEKMSIWENI